EPAARVFLYEPARVLVCLHCKAAIRPGKKVTVHFRRKHKSKEDELQRIIQLAAAAATTVASTGGLVDPYMADLPADDNTPIQQLAVQEG
ncbi:uncharacterized protein B0I36DRAFT_225258, partial [Microdochium trichocladiopsis]